MAEVKNEGRIFLAQGLSGKLEFKVDMEGIFFYIDAKEIFRMHSSEAKDLLKTIVSEFLAYNMEDADQIALVVNAAGNNDDAWNKIEDRFLDGKITRDEAIARIGKLGLKPEVEADLISRL